MWPYDSLNDDMESERIPVKRILVGIICRVGRRDHCVLYAVTR